MTEQTFSLIPFSNSNIPAIQITGCVSRENGFLNLQYRLAGETGKIQLPERSTSPVRKDDLWANTCFEFFLAFPDDSRYWEFNLSPSGDWNVYHMEAYRRMGFREETSIQRLEVEMKREAGYVLLNADVDLSPLISGNQRLQLGIASIVQSANQHETYWALAHPHPKPDFHVRDSFLIQL